MLKRLELIGFKSFADRTAFEFAAGITAVVGPNGSGKSNVVDAVKWVLGEQSAKSLRSGGMADVIFNGSTTRRPHSQAEVTLTFDNARGILATPASEVCIGRRVFRDGTSEYLINGQVGRLKGIRDLFLGTGAGVSAYCIIEQGRVDALLQASQDDRRAIFEEAAGVSRYRVKKIECLRRLERVAQNIARLQDILTEVEHQLRTVRLQAAKALKFQEHSTRLKELRLALGLRDYQSLVARLSDAETKIADLRGRMETCKADSTGWNERAEQIESSAASIQSQLRLHEQTQSDAKARAEVLTGSINRDRNLIVHLGEDMARDQTRLATLDRQTQDAIETATRINTETTAAEQQVEAATKTADEIAERISDISKAIATARHQIETTKDGHLERLREAARWQNDAISVKAQIDQLTRQRDRMSSRTAKAATNLVGLDAELESLRQAESQLEDSLSKARERLAAERRRRDASKKLIADCQTELAELRSQAASLDSRIHVLESWNRDHSGINAGVQIVLEQLKQSEANCILGWIPDVLSVSRDDAPLIDLALGARANHFVVSDINSVLQWLSTQPEPLPSRVGFIALTTNKVVQQELCDDGPIPASSLIRAVQPELIHLPHRLLGDTFIVPDLATAREFAGRHPHNRFMTRAGEILEADGSVVVGRQSDEIGVVSRKSELRDLLKQSSILDDRIADVDTELAALEDQVAVAEAAIASNAQEAAVFAEQLADLRGRIGRHNDRRSVLHSEVSVSHAELSALEADIKRDDRQWRDSVAKAESATAAAQDHHARQIELEKLIGQYDRQQQQLQQTHTSSQITLARARERLESLRAQHAQSLEAVTERQTDAKSLADQIAAVERRINECRKSNDAAQSELVEVQANRDAAEQAAKLLAVELASLTSEQNQLYTHLQAAQAEWQRFNAELHGHELSARDVTNQRDALTARLAEDYQIDLTASLAAEQSPSLGNLSPEQAQAAIDELRNQLQRLGSVNLESLDELTQIEQKHQELHRQFDDLS
jgi:chromosome segregation protein